MTVVGLIAEYNPFHNGHLYHLERAKELTHADYVVIVMSGNFTQRGLPSIYDKHTRTAMALSSGADLVLEMPAAYATGSAKDFASCGVALLNQLGIVDAICFGSECGDIELLTSAATIFSDEPEDFSRFLKQHLKSGYTFPEARYHALLDYYQTNHSNSDHLRSLLQTADILNAPNNILGIEYIQALLQLNSPIKPITITRSGHGYHDMNLSGKFASASAIRESLNHVKHNLTEIRSQVPACVLPYIKNGLPIVSNHLSELLNYTVLTMRHQRIPLSSYADVSVELASRILASAYDYDSLDERTLKLKTKQYTYTRVSRALLHLILGITKDQMASYQTLGYAPYARVLGFRKASDPLLSSIKAHSGIPLITKVADAHKVLTPEALAMLEQDIYCSHVYQSLVHEIHGVLPKNEYTQPIILA